MRGIRRERPLRQRVIALAAAYLIALASLITSFGTGAAAAADAAGIPGGLICHHADDGQSSPSKQTNGDICVDCCLGCVMLTAGLPPPPLNAVALSRSASRTIHFRAITLPAIARHAKFYHSRAPPQTA